MCHIINNIVFSICHSIENSGIIILPLYSFSKIETIDDVEMIQYIEIKSLENCDLRSYSYMALSYVVIYAMI